MSPAKVHRYLASLVREGIIEKNRTNSRYDFDGAARQIGQAALARLDIIRIGTTVLLDLHSRLHETVLLDVWGNGGATVIYSLTAPKPVSIHVRVGSVLTHSDLSDRKNLRRLFAALAYRNVELKFRQKQDSGRGSTISAT
jgi:DNA-binding IclR family transcriptional regulator